MIHLSGRQRKAADRADGTAEFIAAMNAVFAVQEGALTVEAPAITLDAVQLIRESGAFHSRFSPGRIRATRQTKLAANAGAA